jgi:hypothetical protein
VTHDREAAALAERLRIQAGHCERLGSTLYAELLSRGAEDVLAGGPVWAALRGHERDPAGSALALRLMGAVNRVVLEGDAPGLAARYSVRDSDPVAAWPAFAVAIEANLVQIREGIHRPVQTNEVGRCAALLPGFLAVASIARLPLRLLEVGASAGLNLRWDLYRYEANGFAWGPRASPLHIAFELSGAEPPTGLEVEVAERRGCDASPLDPRTEEGRLTLLSYLWPDQFERRERMLAALEIARAMPVAVEQASAAPWVAERLAEDGSGLATVIYHSIVLQYLAEDERTAFVEALAEAGARATPDAPLAWLRMEAAGKQADVRLTTWPGGEERHIARAGYHGTPVELLE